MEKQLYAWSYHWTISSYRNLEAYLRDYYTMKYDIISVSAYGWLNPRVLIVYRIHL